MKIEEILGFSSSAGKDAETISKRYYVRCGPNEGTDEAKTAFEAFAENLAVPDGLERGDVGLEEDKNVNGLYYGTVTFKSPSPKIKRKIADDLFETFGEKMSEGRKSASHERSFRVKADNAHAALQRLESYIHGTARTSGRLHLGDITVDEERNGDGFFTGHVVYGNPDTHGSRDKLDGITAAYGARYTVEPASDIDIGIEFPDENGLFSDPATENIAPPGVEFGCIDDQSRSLFAGPVFAGANLGIWVRETILDGTQARSDIEGDLSFEYY